ncbi:uncharacterized protein LDX57_010982 [Aspergillus melleus]|uniref:uncharacterized protein n=1 Tax=Aspergillus melleus TaxID=138277 RepID=UPI001E8E36B1|nr:uncharacterized protein LDX57_010982 [Aspergillus melleus]KAH8433347.1 hypothetical protein LDX57_010982 [Aspergillus melleus]
MAADSLTIETFTEYALGMCFLLLRLYARIKYVGLRSLGMSDALAIMAMIFWTMQTVIIHLLSIFGNNIGLNEQTAMQVPESKVPDMILGSKLAFMNWIWYLCYIWCLKGVLLCLYHKMTDGTSWHRLVHAASIFCVITWLACMLTHICVCTPIPRNWQIKPYAGDNCTLRTPNYIVIAVLNVASDLVCLIIPIPVLAKLQIPLARKLVLVVLFSSGLFIMICTILRAYYSLKSISTLSIALGWADRECFVAAMVASLPGIKPLFRNTGWFGSTNRGKSSGKPTGAYASFGSKYPGTNKTYVSSFGKDTDRFELIERQEKSMGTRQSSAGDSVEQILPPGEPHDPHRITVTREYILEEDRASPAPEHR